MAAAILVGKLLVGLEVPPTPELKSSKSKNTYRQPTAAL